MRQSNLHFQSRNQSKFVNWVIFQGIDLVRQSEDEIHQIELRSCGILEREPSGTRAHSAHGGRYQVEQVTQPLRSLAALPEDQSWVASTQVKWLLIACSYSSRR